MASYQSPLTAIIKGAIAGAAGTAVMGVFMERAPELMERMGRPMPPSPPGPTAPDTPNEEVAQRLAEGLADASPLTAEAKATAGEAVHWAYGSAWGALYGVVQSSIKLPHFIHGTVFGALVGVVADTVMPAMRLQNKPTENPTAANVMHFAAHLVYGWTTALVWGVLNLGRRG